MYYIHSELHFGHVQYCRRWLCICFYTLPLPRYKSASNGYYFKGLVLETLGLPHGSHCPEKNAGYRVLLCHERVIQLVGV
jgi:hypothetical protein